MIYIIPIIHEYGHYLAAKITRLPVKVFSIGLGPSIIKLPLKNMDLNFSFFPGGYVQTSLSSEDFFKISLSRRILFSSGGPLINLIMSIILITFYFILREQSPKGVDFHSIPGLFAMIGYCITNIHSGYAGVIKIFLILNIFFTLLNLIPTIFYDGGKIIFYILENKLKRYMTFYLKFSFFLNIGFFFIIIILSIKDIIIFYRSY
jgi:membrane-associated protease RseP (regulator of RpoE activity)